MNKNFLLFFVFLYAGYTAQASQLTAPASRFGTNQVSSIVSRYWKLPAFGLGVAAFFQSNVGISSGDLGSWQEIKATLKEKYGVLHRFYWKEIITIKLRYLDLRNQTNMSPTYHIGSGGNWYKVKKEKGFLDSELSRIKSNLKVRP